MDLGANAKETVCVCMDCVSPLRRIIIVYIGSYSRGNEEGERGRERQREREKGRGKEIDP